MTDREIMQMALDSLRLCTALPTWPSIIPTIEALRTALAQPEFADAEPEPERVMETIKKALDRIDAAPVAKNESGRITWLVNDWPQNCLLYTAPPKKEWVGLSDEEMMVAAFQAGFDVHEDYDNEDDPDELHWWTEDGDSSDDTLHKLRDIIEAKLKDKNT